MVNYCCVKGCGRNSRQHSHLKYYSLPKERNRQIDWLTAAGRSDLLDKEQDKLTVSHRFCSRHFAPTSIRNRHLHPDAVPTVSLPGDIVISDDESEMEPVLHSGIICNNCNGTIEGFRYKCITCEDYDLCQKCETQETHPQHYMLRMPKPLKFKHSDNLKKKWKKLFKMEHVTPDVNDSTSDISDTDSNDDEPIKKYVKNYDSGVDLSEDVKIEIQNEVARALSESSENLVKETPAVKKRQATNDGDISEFLAKKQKLATQDGGYFLNDSYPPEVAFADVNEMNVTDVKTENAQGDSCSAQGQEPVVHGKLSDNLSELSIENVY